MLSLVSERFFKTNYRITQNSGKAFLCKYDLTIHKGKTNYLIPYYLDRATVTKSTEDLHLLRVLTPHTYFVAYFSTFRQLSKNLTLNLIKLDTIHHWDVKIPDTLFSEKDYCLKSRSCCSQATVVALTLAMLFQRVYCDKIKTVCFSLMAKRMIHFFK